ncbi:MAG TPA: amidase domain-containing protein [Amnibacterium sp.]|jgi:hypothetical protein|uniref:amidase domain-containing protein n=1 Tax=Amnibacterium sp. TaxID=1872496 RepID=UPI002F957E16
MPIDPRRCASLVATVTLLAGLALNAAFGGGAEALTGRFGTVATATASSTPAPTVTPTPGVTSAPTPTPTPTPKPTPLPEPVATSLSGRSGGTAAMRTVTMHGSSMANVARVVVGSQDAQQLTLLSPTALRFVVPTAQDFVPGTVPIALVSATDRAWIPTHLTWTYAVRNGVDREMAYAAANWNQRRSARFGYIPKNDCVNFTSQLLTARGWKESAAWFDDGPVSHTVIQKKTVAAAKRVPVTTTKKVHGKTVTVPVTITKKVHGTTVKTAVMKTVKTKVVEHVKKVVTTVAASAPWVSSTAMSGWLASRPDLATRLTYAQRDEVRVGDIVQFNWTGVGSSWDHTAVVSKIVVDPDGTRHIWYAEHTNHQLYGGSIGTLSMRAGYRHMRVQFWLLKH